MPIRHLFARTIVLASLSLHVLFAQPAQAVGTTLLGIYYGNQGWKMDAVQHMEAWQGKKHAVVNMFTNWCNRTKDMDNLFKQQLLNIWNNQNVPMITWEPYICTSAGTPADVEVRAARGEYDAYLRTWSSRLQTFLSGRDGIFNTADDRRVYLRLGHEMNGDWYPWGAAVGSNTPADYVNMWLHVKAIFDSRGLGPSHVQWIWSVNHEDVGGFTAEQYYPGDASVDWVAIDGYNWGESQTWSDWKTPAQTFDAMIRRLRMLTAKPLALTETGSTTMTASGSSVAAKSQWITDLFDYLPQQDVRMIVWFNEDKETEWAVFGGATGDSTHTAGRTTYRTYSGYRSAISGSSLVLSESNTLRLLSDAQFSGQ